MQFTCDVGTPERDRGDGDWRVTARTETAARRAVEKKIPDGWVIHSIKEVQE